MAAAIIGTAATIRALRSASRLSVATASPHTGHAAYKRCEYSRDSALSPLASVWQTLSGDRELTPLLGSETDSRSAARRKVQRQRRASRNVLAPDGHALRFRRSIRAILVDCGHITAGSEKLKRHLERACVPIGHAPQIPFVAMTASDGGVLRSEERRVGKECRSRWSPYH